MSRTHPIRLAGAGLLVLAPVLLSSAAAREDPASSEKPVPYVLAGVDIFGNSRTPESQILSTLGIKEGEEITPAVVTLLDDKLRGSGKFVYSKVSSAAYGDKKSYLTVDVVEKGE